MKRPRRLSRNVWLTGFTSLFTDMSSEMVYPLVPFYLTIRLGVGPEIIGVVEGIAESLAALLRVYSGRISDRIGRRKGLAIGGYTASSIGKLLLYLAVSWPMVLAGRVVDRFGKGIRVAPRDAIVAESAPCDIRGRAFGLHRALDTTGAVIGASIALFVVSSTAADPGVYSTVFLLALIPAIVGVVVLAFVRETGTARPAVVPPTFRLMTLDRRLTLFLVASGVFALGNSSNTFLLLRAEDLGTTVAGALFLYVLFNLAHGIVCYPAGWLSDHIGRRTLIVAGYLSFGLIYTGFAVLGTPSLLPVLFIAYGVSVGLGEGVEKALLADIAPETARATLLGLHATIVGVGLLPASLIAGFVWRLIGPETTFSLSAFFGFASAILMAIALWRRPDAASDQEERGR